MTTDFGNTLKQVTRVRGKRQKSITTWSGSNGEMVKGGRLTTFFCGAIVEQRQI